MSDTIETDPKKGFVAFPMSVFELDLTPGAFRTLAELCRMANREGECWPSLAQLGDRLGRSRAAVSGYIAELREAGLIETETQRMANGYNYRLRYRVVFWQEWRDQLGRRNERSVQPAERLTDKNQNQENQSPLRGSNDMIRDWKMCVGRATYPDFDRWPSQLLLERTHEVIVEEPEAISADIITVYAQFLRSRDVDPHQTDSNTTAFLRRSLTSTEQVDGFIATLEKAWKPHWRKPPSLFHLKRLIKALPQTNSSQAQAKLLASYLKRWEIHAQSLSLADRSAMVAA